MILERKNDTYFVTYKNRNVDLNILSEKITWFFKSEKFITTINNSHPREYTITATKNNNITFKLLDRQETWFVSIKGDTNNFIVSVPYQRSRPQWFYIMAPMIVQFGESYDREFLKKLDLVINDTIRKIGNRIGDV